ncbi:MAG: phosphotransferase [Saprospiraceae bacterium]|nr:phosphotransferase [Saprospiraceae bacterium]
MLKNALKIHFNLEILDIQLIKRIDTLVFKIETTDKQYFVAKLYKKHNRVLIEKIAQNALFLSFIKTHTALKVQAAPNLFFPLIDWENEKRYLVLGDWIEGSPPSVVDAALCYKMGAMMAQLHKAAEYFSTLHSQSLNVLNIDNVLVQAVKHKIIRYKQVLKVNENELDKAFLGIENTYKKYETTPSVWGLIHSDLHFKNVIQNGDDLSPIDFDEVAYGYYWLDIAITFNEIENKKESITLKRAYIKGYKKHRSLPKDFSDQIIDFQRMAHCIYLNWLLAEGNEELMKNEKLARYAEASLANILL